MIQQENYIMNIDPDLQAFLEPQIKIAQATFAVGAERDQLVATALATFSGMGLVTTVKQGDDYVWIGTDLLKEVTKTPPAPVDLTPFMKPLESRADGSTSLMTESLRL